MNKKPLKIVANTPLLYCGIIFVVIMFLLCFYIAFFEIAPDFVDSPKDTNLIRAIFVFLGIAILGAGIMCLPRWMVTITFEKDVIKFKSAFHKEVTKSYNNYQFVYFACYSHLGFPVKFIVLSTRKMNKNELENINKVKSDGQIIKIKYNEKTLTKLQPFLTEKQNNQLNKQLNK